LPKTTPGQKGQGLVRKHNKPFVLLSEIQSISPGENVNQFFFVKIFRLPAENQALMTISFVDNHFQCGNLLTLPGGNRQK